MLFFGVRCFDLLFRTARGEEPLQLVQQGRLRSRGRSRQPVLPVNNAKQRYVAVKDCRWPPIIWARCCRWLTRVWADSALEAIPAINAASETASACTT